MKDQGLQEEKNHQAVNGAQVYPMPNIQVHGSRMDDSSSEFQRQTIGYFTSVVFAIVVALSCVICSIKAFYAYKKFVYYVLLAISCGIMLCFMAVVLHYPAYLSGKPSKVKSWPIWLTYTLLAVAVFVDERHIEFQSICGFLMMAAIQCWIMFQDDSSSSLGLNLKPWVYKKKTDNVLASYHPNTPQDLLRNPIPEPPPAYSSIDFTDKI